MFTTTADRSLTCVDCSAEFVFTASEQEFYAERQFSEPRRCPSCRAARKLSRGSSGDPARQAGSFGGSRQMYSTTCSSCGREAQVPFQPTGSKPVYCSDCFSSQRQSYR